MIRPILFAAALLLSATAAGAQGYYDARPATAPVRASVITGGVLWKCADGICSAGKTSARDPIVCEQVVRRVGTLSSFAVDGTPFDAAALGKCNARAK